MNSLPFWDLHGRTMGLGSCVSTIEGLLRLQNARRPERPITLYVVGNSQAPDLTADETLMICDVILSLASPVQTIGMGFLSATQSIVLAAGTGRRWVLPHSILFLHEISFNAPGNRPLGINACSLVQPAQEASEQQFRKLMIKLNIPKYFSEVPRTLCASAAVEHGFADQVFKHHSTIVKKEVPNEHCR
ncbi:ATP-dependent Clp protease proteolytic subunit [bioreactor metagenome]|uniref:ATP-dependent Clp protease proteolytic subunit n=1 Tax=bioreactor metagenome TaxID=1076179 RepID=A0A645EMB8_9ZZZZ